MFQEDIYPSGQVNSIVFIANCNFFQKFVCALKYFRNLVSDSSILWRLIVAFNFLERFIENEKNFDKKFSDSSLNKYFLNGCIGCISWWTDVLIVSSVYFSGNKFDDIDDVDQLILIEFQEKVIFEPVGFILLTDLS